MHRSLPGARPRAAFIVLAALVLLAAARPAAAVLLGRVVDAETGEALPRATVMIVGLGPGEPVAADGAFRLEATPQAAFTLVASAEGYAPRLVKVHPELQAGADLVVRLAPTFYRMEKMVITASRYSPAVHLSQANITRADIQRHRDEKDLPLLLEHTPGLHASQDAGNGVGYTYLKLRGFDQRRVGVMINGIPLNDPEDHQVYWVDMPDLAASLEDVQVQRGVTNSLGGMTAIGGTVNLVTEVLGDAPGGHFSAAAGSFGTTRQSLAYQTGLLGGRLAASLRISHLASDGYRDRSGSDQWGVFWSGRYLTPATSTQVNIYTGRELSHHAWDGISEEMLATDRTYNPETYENAVDDFRQPHYELHHRWQAAERVLVENSLYWIHGEGFYENFKSDRTAADFGLDAHLGLAPDAEVDLVRRKNVDKDQAGWVGKLLWDHPRGRLVVGGDFYDFHSRHWGDLQAVEGFATGDLVGLSPYYDYVGDKQAGSIYANEQLELGGGFTLLADLHLQRKTYDFAQRETGNFRGADRHAYSLDYDFFNPKGGLFWRAPGAVLGGELGLYAHVGVSHREPTDADVFDTWLGPDDLGAAPLFARSDTVRTGGAVNHIAWSDPLVQEERVLDYELGLSWRAERLSLHLNGYLMEFENEIVPYGAVDADGRAIRGNADKTLHRGVELGLTARLGRGAALRLAASRSWDEYETFTVYEDVYDPGTWEYVETVARDWSGNPIALFPEYLVSATLDLERGPVAGSLRLRGAGKQYLDNAGDEDRTIDAYAVLDLGLRLAVGPLGLSELSGATVELKVANLLDEEYETWGYYDPWGVGNAKIPAATRHFLLGVRYEF
ncbi:MAG: TonB-dependent receptor [Candidatus Krumholzibacteriota bacterium]|nr:TonB-dependent receptor [Candidatus Krumholzibacteriota bacterium]